MSSKKKAKIKANKDTTQGKLKAQLHSQLRSYHKARVFEPAAKLERGDITLRSLRQLQKDINRLRKEIGKQPVKYVENMVKRLKSS